VDGALSVAGDWPVVTILVTVPAFNR
jgi:hypothetical protein